MRLFFPRAPATLACGRERYDLMEHIGAQRVRAKLDPIFADSSVGESLAVLGLLH